MISTKRSYLLWYRLIDFFDWTRDYVHPWSQSTNLSLDTTSFWKILNENFRCGDDATTQVNTRARLHFWWSRRRIYERIFMLLLQDLYWSFSLRVILIRRMRAIWNEISCEWDMLFNENRSNREMFSRKNDCQLEVVAKWNSFTFSAHVYDDDDNDDEQTNIGLWREISENNYLLLFLHLVVIDSSGKIEHRFSQWNTNAHSE